MNNYRRFIIIFLSLSFSLAAVIILFNWIVDPYQIHQTPLIKNFNEVKVVLAEHERLHKALEIAHQKPKAIILGSSRISLGFNPDDLAAIVKEPAYNAGLGGASFEEIYHYFKHALYHQPDLKAVVIGIDGFAFNRHKKMKKDCLLERLSAPGLIWKDISTSLFSYSALKSSSKTIHQNLQGAQAIFLPNGWCNAHLMHDPKYNPILATGNLEFIRSVFKTTFYYRNYEIDEEKIDLFKEIVQTCQDKGICLKIFIVPSQIIYWEALYRQGVGFQVDSLKKKLCSLSPIWDFTGYALANVELNKNHNSLYYFECSHFTDHTGRLILAKMFDQENKDPLLNEFGILLTSDNVDDHLKVYHERRKAWIKDHPDIVQELEEGIRQFKKS